MDRLADDALVLEPLQAGHAEAMYRILCDAELHRYLDERPPASLDALRKRYEYLERRTSPDGSQHWLNWIVIPAGGAPIGFVQATIQDAGDGTGGSAEIAWVIGTAWQGRGYATEAARALVARLESAGIRSIVAHVHPDHVASATVAERAGLVPTGQVVDGERVWRRIVSEPGASGLGSATRR